MSLTKIYRSITYAEWKFVTAVFLTALIVLNIPYLYGWLAAPSGYVYNGINLLSSSDSPVYNSYITQAAQGNLIPINLFTLESQSHGVFHPVWATLGLASKVFGLSSLLTFQLARNVFSIFLIFGAYFFVSYFFEIVWQRKLSLLALVFSSGLGAWLVVPLLFFSNRSAISAPIDLWVPEANVFLSLYRMPHFIISWCLLMLVTLLTLLAIENQNFKYAVGGGIAALIWFSFHPYYVFYAFGIFAFYLFILFAVRHEINWKNVLMILIVFLISSPVLIYHGWLILTDSAISSRAMQNVTLTPGLIWVMTGYGLLFIMAILAIYQAVNSGKIKQNSKLLFLCSWFMANLLLVYMPIPWQRRMLQGWQLPMVLLSIWYIAWLLSRGGKTATWLRYRPMMVLISILFLFLTSAYVLTRDTFYYYSQTRSDLFYVALDDLAAMDYLSHLPQYQNVMASWLSGIMIPGYSGQKVFAGHGHETLNPLAKLKRTEWFYKSNSEDIAKQEFLSDNDINIIFFGEKEAQAGNFQPGTKPYLKLIYSSGQSALYQVL
ncbi:MAG: hypothetical protein COT81_04370 [Candidatus Buchananbacteria bacterium CG10_big_fil_rev_8_21_14_0_10_42_9]|uniref:Glycosyltransferase RgtA/B/C/D-like domain-containing protein n=1 Tax=Candidatus Buchananbacteria bacterium CG10_big_fil_rev_8_21_14_0_10_42_9 TaxID=1974526 RepID=A0A2H0W2X1_9BACT|nr:MAG: hypothetical protein COT81_04370 [Candidatus Buchananbacteria bacterium CG10_big_fil_rev_8_21_14_0_10_42_9]